jgi:hypothetical protein
MGILIILIKERDKALLSPTVRLQSLGRSIGNRYKVGKTLPAIIGSSGRVSQDGPILQIWDIVELVS